jgi:hypothetical protein
MVAIGFLLAFPIFDSGAISRLSAQQQQQPQIAPPSAPISPKNIADCVNFQNQVDSFKNEISAQHTHCLATNDNSRPGTFGPGQCSAPACQTLHDLLYGNSGAQLDQQADSCRAAVLRYQNRQVAEQGAFQSASDALSALASDNPVTPLDSQGSLSAFDQQSDQQPVLGDNAITDLPVTSDVQTLATSDAPQPNIDTSVDGLARDAVAQQGDQPAPAPSAQSVMNLLKEGLSQTGEVGETVVGAVDSYQAWSNFASAGPNDQIAGFDGVIGDLNSKRIDYTGSKEVSAQGINTIDSVFGQSFQAAGSGFQNGDIVGDVNATLQQAPNALLLQLVPKWMVSVYNGVQNASNNLQNNYKSGTQAITNFFFGKPTCQVVFSVDGSCSQ